MKIFVPSTTRPLAPHVSKLSTMCLYVVWACIKAECLQNSRCTAVASIWFENWGVMGPFL